MDLIKVYPHGQISATVLRRSTLSDLSPEYLEPPLTFQQEVDRDFNLKLVKLDGIERALEVVKEFPSQKESALLDLSIPANLRKRKPRGLNGITSHGRRTVKDGAAILQRDYGCDNLSFLTLTLPPQYVEHAARSWEKIVKNFRNKMIYHLGRVGLPQHFLGVTEIQEKRYSRYGEIALHLHCVFVGRHERTHWAFTPDEFKKYWRDSIVNTTKIDVANTYWNACVNVQRVKKSVVGYLGKYMSKGVSLTKQIIEDGHSDKLPSSWYVCSHPLRWKIVESVRVFSGDTARDMFDFFIENADELLSFHRFVELDLPDGHRLKVGWYGYLDASRGVTPDSLFG